MAMPQWYVWGLLTPGIVAVDRRLLASRRLGDRLAWHALLGVAWTLLAIAIRLTLRLLPGRAFPPSIPIFFLQRFCWDLLVYAVIAGVAVARDYARQVREQERETHRLQLESEALQRTLAEARLQSLRSQLQPHFLFNALNTISSLTESDPRTARRLMEQLGQLLRASLRHATTPLVTLAEELTFLDDYLAIETVRFEGRINVSVQADDDTLDALVPGDRRSPNSTRGTAPACRTCPGPATKLMILQRPPSTRSSPITFAISSDDSTPFSSGTTKVSGPRSGAIRPAASGTCQALTATSTTSTGPCSAGSSATRTGWTTKSPAMLSTRSPSRRMASRWAPRATNATSCPAWARRPPK
jgi:hypothetical protein